MNQVRPMLSTDRVLRRVARVADGWFPRFLPDHTGRAKIARVRELAQEAGRDPSSIGMDALVNASDGDPEFWQTKAAAWKELGATHISVNTMGAGLQSPQDHINTIRQFKEVIAG